MFTLQMPDRREITKCVPSVTVLPLQTKRTTESLEGTFLKSGFDIVSLAQTTELLGYVGKILAGVTILWNPFWTM